jgi:putative PEP-CTERM system histidine kinase
MIAQQLASGLSTITLSSHIIAALLYVIAAIIPRYHSEQSGGRQPLQLLAWGAVLLQLALILSQADIFQAEHQSIFYMLCYGLWIFGLWRLLEAASGQALSIATKTALTSFILIAFGAIALRGLLPTLYIQRVLAHITDSHYLFAVIASNLILIIILCEQCIRNASKNYLSQVRYAALGIGILVMLQLYRTGFFFLFKHEEMLIKDADGFINIFVALLFVMSALRDQPQQPLTISRKIAFYGTSFTLIGIFLLSMGLAGYYVQIKDASWSSAVQLVIFILTFLAVCYAVLSTRMRRTIRVFVNKHFFRHKYDYRSVWLDLIHTLSGISEHDNFYHLSLQAVARIFDANGGAMWLTDNEDQINLATSWNVELPKNIPVEKNNAFIKEFSKQEWIYAFNTSGRNERSHHPAPPEWLTEIPNLWILSPMLIGEKLIGFFVLTRNDHDTKLIWEDIDVIKSAGRQLASYVVRQKSAEQLAEARQFDAYNKFTAFIMHDLKNLIAQQALVVQNAHKHKENPAFVEDAIRTIDNSVARMNHLLKRLQRNPAQTAHRSISVRNLILEVIRKSADRQPIPTLRSQKTDAMIVADQDQLVMILLHIVRNAQDATDSDGFIDINMLAENDHIRLEIEDNGHGMDQEFIKNRLFKPFESTKSSMGMGIGAYQVREFIRAMGGQIQVRSEKNAGTTVYIELPISVSTKLSVSGE